MFLMAKKGQPTVLKKGFCFMDLLQTEEYNIGALSGMSTNISTAPKSKNMTRETRK
jgi:hypothetical protein